MAPKAKAVITEMNTGISRRMETNASGNYIFAALEPGTYRVLVEQPGFRTAVKEGVALLALLVETELARKFKQPEGLSRDYTFRTGTYRLLQQPVEQADRADADGGTI